MSGPLLPSFAQEASSKQKGKRIGRYYQGHWLKIEQTRAVEIARAAELALFIRLNNKVPSRRQDVADRLSLTVLYCKSSVNADKAIHNSAYTDCDRGFQALLNALLYTILVLSLILTGLLRI